MHKAFVIARREYLAMVGSKAFLFSLAIMPFFMLGGAVIPTLLRESAAMAGDVSVLGLQNHLAVWNQKRLTERLFKKEPFTDEDGRVLSGFGI